MVADSCYRPHSSLHHSHHARCGIFAKESNMTSGIWHVVTDLVNILFSYQLRKGSEMAHIPIKWTTINIFSVAPELCKLLSFVMIYYKIWTILVFF